MHAVIVLASNATHCKARALIHLGVSLLCRVHQRIKGLLQHVLLMKRRG